MASNSSSRAVARSVCSSTCTLVGGRRAGLGAVAGGACHTAMGALGVGVVLKLFLTAFKALPLASAGTAWEGRRLSP